MRIKHLLAVSIPVLLLVILYSSLFGSYGWHPSDQEYVFACMHRIMLGEIPYRDFIYHKPPGTLYLNLLWLFFPDGAGVYFSRSWFYFQIVCAGFFPVYWGLRRAIFNLEARLLLLVIASCCIALHNFPAMPWQTADGIFLSTIGIVFWLESRYRNSSASRLSCVFIGSLFLTFAVLCKQSFAVLLGLVPILLLFEYLLLRSNEERNGFFVRIIPTLFASLIAVFFVALGFWYWLYSQNALPDFILQMQAQSTLPALLEHLGKPFTLESLRFAGIFLLLPVIRAMPSRFSQCFGSLVFLALAYFCMPAWSKGNFRPDIWKLGDLVFASALGIFLGNLLSFFVPLSGASKIRTREESSAARSLILLQANLLGLGAATTLSLGYATPLLGMAAAGIFWRVLLPKSRNWIYQTLPAILFLGGTLYYFVNANLLHPYRDQPVSRLNKNLGEVFPKLRGIYSTASTLEKYKELVALITSRAITRERSFVLTDDYPGMYWLLDQKSPWSIPWVLWEETRGHEERLFAELLEARPLIIVPRRQKQGGLPDACALVADNGYNRFARFAANNGSLLVETKNFCAFELDPQDAAG